MTDWNKARELMDPCLEVFYVKNVEVNKQREQDKETTLDWLIDEMRQGPLPGGHRGELPGFTWTFGTGGLWDAESRGILIRDEMCFICHERPSKEVHHIRPRFLHGSNHPRNLVGLCLECHDEIHRSIDNGIQKVLVDSLDIKPPKMAKDILSFCEGGNDD